MEYPHSKGPSNSEPREWTKNHPKAYPIGISECQENTSKASRANKLGTYQGSGIKNVILPLNSVTLTNLVKNYFLPRNQVLVIFTRKCESWNKGTFRQNFKKLALVHSFSEATTWFTPPDKRKPRKRSWDEGTGDSFRGQRGSQEEGAGR